MIITTEYPLQVTKCEFRVEPVVIYINKFDEDSAKLFETQMSQAHDSKQTVVPVIINSYGGIVDSLMSMITNIESSEIPVATVCTGKAMSCGSILLSMGTPGYRFVDQHARIMIHEMAAGDWGKVTDIQTTAEELKRFNEYVFVMMSRKCNKYPNYFQERMRERNNADWFLTPAEAVTHGLADRIHMPRFTRRVQLSYDFA